MKKKYLKALNVSNIQQEDPFILNHKLLSLLEQPHSENLQFNQQNQDYRTFIEMKNVQPNEQGTGRTKRSNINCLRYILITNGQEIDNTLINHLKQIISIYLGGITIQMAQYNLNVKKSKIIDNNINLQYSIKYKNKNLDALEILSLLLEYKKQKQLLIGLIQANLSQQDSQIDGRAIGDGVAIISINKEKETKNQYYNRVITIAIHQILHLFGLQHCVLWKCLMNPITNNEYFLCPCCMKKLYSEMKFQIKKWYENLKKFHIKLKNRGFQIKCEAILQTF